MLKLFAALFIALSSLTAQSADLNLKKDNLEIGKFNFETKRVLLNSGYYMPLVGLSTTI